MQLVPSHCDKTCNSCPARENARRIRLLAIKHNLALDLLKQLQLSKCNLLKQAINRQQEFLFFFWGVSNYISAL